VTAIRIPPTLREEVGGERQVEASGGTVRELLEDLAERYPALAPQLFDNGSVAPFVNVYLGGEDVRTLDGTETPVREGDTIILLPAMAGGSVGVLAGDASRPAEPASGAASRRSRHGALRVCASCTIPSGHAP
jgi:sulfur-carrier protein